MSISRNDYTNPSRVSFGAYRVYRAYRFIVLIVLIGFRVFWVSRV